MVKLWRPKHDWIGTYEQLAGRWYDDLHIKGIVGFLYRRRRYWHVVGMLRIQDLLTIDRKSKNLIAETVMKQSAIRENLKLYSMPWLHFVQHHLFIVAMSFEKQLVYWALEDVIEALLGQKIIDDMIFMEYS